MRNRKFSYAVLLALYIAVYRPVGTSLFWVILWFVLISISVKLTVIYNFSVCLLCISGYIHLWELFPISCSLRLFTNCFYRYSLLSFVRKLNPIYIWKRKSKTVCSKQMTTKPYTFLLVKDACTLYFKFYWIIWMFIACILVNDFLEIMIKLLISLLRTN